MSHATPPTEPKVSDIPEQNETLPVTQSSTAVQREEETELSVAHSTDSSEGNISKQNEVIPDNKVGLVGKKEGKTDSSIAQSTESLEGDIPEQNQTTSDSQPSVVEKGEEKTESSTAQSSEVDIPEQNQTISENKLSVVEEMAGKAELSTAQSTEVDIQKQNQTISENKLSVVEEMAGKAELSTAQSTEVDIREQNQTISENKLSVVEERSGKAELSTAQSTEVDIREQNQTISENKPSVVEDKAELSTAQSTEASDINIPGQNQSLSESQLSSVVQRQENTEATKTQSTELKVIIFPERTQTLPDSQQCNTSKKPTQKTKQPPPTAPKPYVRKNSVETGAELKEAITPYKRSRTLTVPAYLPYFPASSTLPHLKAARTAARSREGPIVRPKPPPKPPRLQIKKSFKGLETLPDNPTENDHNDKNDVHVNGAQTMLSPPSDQQPISDYERPVSQSGVTPTASIPSESQSKQPHAPLTKHISLPSIMMEESPQGSGPFKFPQIHSPQKKWSPTASRKIEHYGLQAKNLPLFKAMTLSELSKKYSKFFPLKIQITEGHYGTSCKNTISTDDRLNVHFKKRTKEVVIQYYGQDYTVPLSSAIKFGLVFDPSNNETQAMEGHTFRRVVDLMSVQPLPKLVLVMSGCFCSNGVSIDRDELLVVLKIQRKLLRGKRMLKVFSLQTMSKKMLPEECIGNFSTRPLCLQIYLSQLLEYVPNAFPCKAMMYIDKDDGDFEGMNEEGLPIHMFSWPVIVKEPIKQKSLVASSESTQQLVDIPLHGSIAAVKAEIVPLHSSDEIDELFTNTQKFLDQFDPTKVDMYRETTSESVSETQTALYKIVRNSRKCLGVDVVTPLAIKKLKKGTPVLTRHTTLASTGEHIYEKITHGEESEEEYAEVEQVVIRPQVTAAAADDYLENRPLNVTILPKSGNASAPHSGSGSFTYTYLTRQVQPESDTDTFSTDSFLSGDSDSLQQQQPPITEVPLTPSISEENKQYLSTLDVSQVSSLHFHRCI